VNLGGCNARCFTVGFHVWEGGAVLDLRGLVAIHKNSSQQKLKVQKEASSFREIQNSEGNEKIGSISM
jgi:hypothetical protein